MPIARKIETQISKIGIWIICGTIWTGGKQCTGEIKFYAGATLYTMKPTWAALELKPIIGSIQTYQYFFT